jgi:hypothetical protein
MSVYFERVFGAELDGTRADKTELLDFALKTSNADRQHATMICERYPRAGRARGQCSVVSRAALDSQRSRISCSRMFGSRSVPR